MRGKLTGNHKKHIVLAGVAGILLVAAFAFFGDKGLVDVYRLGKERDSILSYNRSLEDENKDLEEQIELLKTDKRYIGYIARKELNMIGRNEAVYKLEDPVKP
ncbi:MAG: septum formation initiator family protein [Deltaproteobacteria bacterium]|nr:septum formation initiator family protein [Deltaproteobacteria bacterium]